MKNMLTNKCCIGMALGILLGALGAGQWVLALVSFVLFHIVPYDKGLQIALMILYSLPAPFIIPLFADVGKEGRYISTSLSVHTLCTILLFAAIAAFSLR